MNGQGNHFGEGVRGSGVTLRDCREGTLVDAERDRVAAFRVAETALGFGLPSWLSGRAYAELRAERGGSLSLSSMIKEN